MDEFELAGFDEETCEQLRKLSAETGIEPERLICVARQHQTAPHNLSEYGHLAISWDVFLQTVWDEFANSKIGKFMILLADKLCALLARFIK